MILIPSIEKIYEGHSAVIKLFGGSDGVIAQREQLLHSALDSLENHIQYRGELRPAFLAALLCIRIVNAHAFIDGNKRAGVFALQIMLEKNGMEIREEDQMKVYDFLLAAISKVLSESEFCEEINRLSRPL
ncbi:hypothetical protein BH09SUM1_BH09SUM1_23430 [soil metagenome]